MMHMTQKSSNYIDKEFLYRHVNSKTDEPKEIPSHIHDAIELLFVKKGDLTYYVDGKSFRVKNNSLIISWPNKIHSIVVGASCEYDRYGLIFDRKNISDAIYDSLPREIDVLSFGSIDTLLSLFEKLEYYHMFFEKEIFKKLLQNTIEEIICNITILLKNNPEIAVYNRYKTNDELAKMLQYVDEHITTDFSLDEMSKDLHISKSQLHKTFVQSLNITPKKYIISRRLVLVQKDLKNKLKPTEVYLKYGFNDYSSFYRAYKKYFGVAPSEEVELKFIREMID